MTSLIVHSLQVTGSCPFTKGKTNVGHRQRVTGVTCVPDVLRMNDRAPLGMHLEELDSNHVLTSELPRHAPDLPPPIISVVYNQQKCSPAVTAMSLQCFIEHRGMKAYWGGGITPHILILMKANGQFHVPAVLLPRRNP